MKRKAFIWMMCFVTSFQCVLCTQPVGMLSWNVDAEYKYHQLFYSISVWCNSKNQILKFFSLNICWLFYMSLRYLERIVNKDEFSAFQWFLAHLTDFKLLVSHYEWNTYMIVSYRIGKFCLPLIQKLMRLNSYYDPVKY